MLRFPLKQNEKEVEKFALFEKQNRVKKRGAEKKNRTCLGKSHRIRNPIRRVRRPLLRRLKRRPEKFLLDARDDFRVRRTGVPDNLHRSPSDENPEEISFKFSVKIY